MSGHEQLRRTAAELGLTIAIDGPAGAGKSTVGRGLADTLGCCYLDTGLMYRAITWLALDRGVATSDAAALEGLARDAHFALADEGQSLLFDGRMTGPFLRTPRVDSSVSAVSAVPEVREQMVRRQREFARGRCIVMVGRDIGTVVLPDAPVKLWVTASPEERARRRLSERLPGSETVSQEEMTEMIEARDARDAGRTVAPLRRAPDAVEIETDRLSPGSSVEKAVWVVERCLLADNEGATARRHALDRSS